jgi:hypothetical protein
MLFVTLNELLACLFFAFLFRRKLSNIASIARICLGFMNEAT